VHDDGTSETQKSELDTTKLEEHGLSFVDDEEVGDLVFLGPEFLEHPHIFASTPYCVDRYVKFDLATDEERELREGKFARGES
jgi:hypothetical protein